MSDDPRLDDLAGRILDGDAVDWDRETSGETPADDSMLAELKVLAEIIELHRGDLTGAAPPPLAPPPGRWGPLTLLEKVGHGSFADVYRAKDPHLDREVALKLLRHSGPPAGVGASVVEEGRLLAAVRHPNVVTVHGAGLFDGRVGIWTEFVQGQTLEDVLAEHGPFSAQETALVGIEMCRALAAVHGAGVIHRDVKARNVMRERGGRFVLMDFGMGQSGGLDRQDQASSGGTPLYMAPELFEGRAANRQTDVYALGVLLWRLLTASYPVAGATLAEVRDAHRSGRRVRLLDQRADVPAALAAAIERAIDPDPVRRFESAGAFEAALQHTLAVATPRRRRGVMVGIAAFVLIGLGLAGWLASRQSWIGGLLTRDPAASAALPFQARDWVLVGAFENHTGLKTLDGVVELALERELANRSGLNVVPRERVVDALTLMKRPLDAPIDRAVGIEVCARDGGIRALVSGRTERAGTHVVVTAAVLDPAHGGKQVALLTAEATGEDGLFEAVRALSDQVRTALGAVAPPAGEHADQGEKATTASFQAFQLYSKARDAASALKWEVSAELCREAIKEDPDFASAHAWLAQSLASSGKRQQARAAIEKAAALAGSVSRRERMFILALKDALFNQKDAAAKEFRAFIQLYPDDVWAINWLVELQEAFSDEMRQLRVHAAELRPRSFSANYSAGFWLMTQAGDLPAARPFFARASALIQSDSPVISVAMLKFLPAFEAWLAGDVHGMKSRLDAALQDGDERPWVLIVLNGLYQALGQYSVADRVLGRVAAGSPPAGAIAVRDLDLATMSFNRRNWAAVQAWVGQMQAAPALPWTSYHAVWMLRRMDRQADAEKLSRARRKADGEELSWLLGDLAIGRGDLDDARKRLMDHWPTMVRGNPTTLMVAESCVDVLERRRETAEAIRVLEESTRDKVRLYGTFRSAIPNWMRLRARLAAAYASAGRSADADAVTAELRRLLVFADPDVDVVRQLNR